MLNTTIELDRPTAIDSQDTGCAARGPWLQNYSVLIPVCGVTFIVLLVKLAGFGEKIIIAKYLGTSQAADCYYAAFSVVWTIVFVFRELLQPTCLPVYVSALLEKDGRRTGDRLVSMIAGTLGLVLGLVAVVLFAWPDWVARIFVPGFGSAARTETAGLIRAMSVGVALLTFTGFTKTLLDAHRRFWWSALGELSFRVVYLLGLVAGFRYLGVGRGVGFSLAIAAMIGLGLHGWILRKHIRLRRLDLHESERAAIRQILLLMSPLLVGVVCSHVGQLVDSVLASTLPAGRLSALAYAKKLTDAIVLMGPVALSTVLFSHFSSWAAEGRLEELRRKLNRCLIVLLAASVPIAVAVVILRYPIVRLLFARGSFNAASTELTAGALGFYGIGIVAMALESLLVSTFYALKEIKIPMLIGVGSITCDIILSFLFMQICGHLGIALAVSVVKSFKVVVLFVLLKRHLFLKPSAS